MPDSNECQSCKDDRAKKGLPPVERIHLPEAITKSPTFRKKKLATIVCAYCDGETLVSSALKTHKAREAKRQGK